MHFHQGVELRLDTADLLITIPQKREFILIIFRCSTKIQINRQQICRNCVELWERWQRICLFVSVCKYLSVCICLYLSVCVCQFVSVCLYLFVCICLFVSVCLYLSVCICLFVSVCLCKSVCFSHVFVSMESSKRILWNSTTQFLFCCPKMFSCRKEFYWACKHERRHEYWSGHDKAVLFEHKLLLSWSGMRRQTRCQIWKAINLE